MAQQRYIYQPTAVEQLQALYSNPDFVAGFTTISNDIKEYKLLYDRAVIDKIDLPYKYEDIKLVPNELATSNTLTNTLDRLHENFIYLNRSATIASNSIPGEYTGYYTCNSTNEPIFVTDKELIPAQAPVLDSTGSIKHDSDQKLLSDVTNGEKLNDLTTGVWIRDNSVLNVTELDSSTENYQFGFLCTSNSLTVVKMSNAPADNTVKYDGSTGDVNGSDGWVVMSTTSNVQDIPGDTNKLTYTNIKRAKVDNKKYLYILDGGVSRPGSGVSGVSSNSTRSMLYIYDVSGYINVNKQNTITRNKRQLISTIGDVNTKSSEANIVEPTAFTVTDTGNIIVYDNHDFTFKIYTNSGEYVDKKPKRNTFYRGATGTSKQYLGVSDIHYDIESSNLYVLSPAGYIFVFDTNYKLIDKIIIPKATSNQSKNLTSSDYNHIHYRSGYPGDAKNEVFNQLEFSKNEPNVYYVLTSNRLVKRFKSRSDINIGVFNMLDNNIGMLSQSTSTTATAYRAKPKFISIVQEANIVAKNFTNADNESVTVVDQARSYTYDQMYMYTDFIQIGNSTRVGETPIDINFILSFKERVNQRSCLIEPSYSIYQMSKLKGLAIKEYNSSFTYNKTFYKLLMNHKKMVNLLHYQLSALYISTGELIYDKQLYISEKEYRELIESINTDILVGVNEYFSTAVVNKLIKQVYDIQSKILNTIRIIKNNKWPPSNINIPLEPYLYTPGGEFQNQDNIDYVGYYYIREQVNGDIYVSGRTNTDGTQNADGSPTTDRYLTQLQ